ncbi:MAG: SRPBCC family protein [Myxococcales bacterium]|nr:SRPBCC family protein [Myxococcales bacterium]
MIQGDENRVRKTLTVKASAAVAWRVFTAQIGTWWPLADYTIGTSRAVDAVIEPRVGGRWYERGEDGSTCAWGTVLTWEPTSRLVLTWDIGADWKYDPNLGTEIEIHFTAEGDRRTRVDLEHRRLDRYGLHRDRMRAVFDKEGDWGRLLARMAEAAEADAGGETP